MPWSRGRAFDIDDVILNTSGALIGYLLPRPADEPCGARAPAPYLRERQVVRTKVLTTS